MHRERGAKVFTIIGAVLLVLGVVLAALPTVARGGGGEGQPDIKVYSIDSFMTAVYKVYGNPNLGYWVAKTVIKNTGSGPLYIIKITYKIEGLTDWSEPKEYKLVPPGGAIVDLYYPILSHPPNVQTTTPGKLYVKIEYKTRPDGEPVTETKTKPINILGSHDFIFSGLPPEENTGSFRDILSNYQLLAAWVTPKDPVVERFADMANKLTGRGAGASLGDKEALAFLQAVWDFSVYNGFTYQTEPTAFWTGKVSQWVKYPRDVIRDKSGTCLDTTIFFNAVAMSQGLKAYILIIPGHAIPIIELPSGQLLPIESTMLGSKASFQQAVNTAVKEVEEALQGPHLIVNVAEMHASGIVPPELPEMPSNVLEQWGYVMPGMGGGVGGGQAPGGGQGGGGTVPQPQPPANMKKITNPFGDLPWSISVPSNWEASKDSYSNAYEVDLSSPDGAVLIAIVWSRSLSANALRSGFESAFNQNYNGYQVKADNANGALGNIPAEIVVYSLGTGDIAIARYTNVQGYGLAVVYLVNQAAVSQDTIAAVEQIVQTFRIGG
ncbi:hypothetical protein [Infirmifilum sp. NZ]|uniref:hypothetical protein n=1 Tax=Infirmifilum sp. NZ TaxID=2926850 RepID=UPI0027989214|nr:hypothetical protein [Infirmifilum sp. NZ]UNQ72999.1 hypothetical protein MOV14_07790 [Infirmifilum sp. NZ]